MMKTTSQAVIRRCAAFRECSHTGQYAALPKGPHALADGLDRRFQQDARETQLNLGLLANASLKMDVDLSPAPIHP
jgi:hypothetical protein